MSDYIRKHGIVIEESPKSGWRIVTRACSSGRVLKVWFDQVELKEAEQLAKGLLKVKNKTLSILD